MGKENKPVEQVETKEPKKKRNGGIIAAVIVIIVLLAAVGVLSYLLLNMDDEDSDKKSSKKSNTTNSAQIEEDEEEPADKDDNEDEDNDKSKKKEVKTVEANGISYLADYSAFDMTIDDIVDILEKVMEDPDQKLKEKNGEYIIELMHDVLCTVKVDDDGYVKKITLTGDILHEDTGAEDSPAAYMGQYFGIIRNSLDIEDVDIVQDGIHFIADTGTATTYDNYEIVKHLKMRLMEEDYDDYATMTFEMSPDKKESGSDKKLN